MGIVKEKLHYYFFSIALILGTSLLIFGPPLTVPDENTHFLNSYTIADGQVFAQNIDGRMGKYIPENVMRFVDENNSKFRGIDSQKYNFKDYYFNSHLTGEEGRRVFSEYWGQDINPISYICSSAGMVIGKILLPEQYELPFNLLLFGRLFNLIFYVAVTYSAIKITPYYKNTMFLLALMPMSIYLGSSLSYDALLIPSTFLLFAYILKLRQSDKIILRDIIIVCSIVFILFSVKQAYAPFALALFAIPSSCFGDKKRYYKIIAIVGAVCIGALIIGNISNLLSLDTGKVIDENINLQKEYLNNNFGIMIPIIFNSFIKYKIFYYTGLIGIFGQLDTNLPMPVLIIFGLILLITVIIDSCSADKIEINFKTLGIVSILIFVYFSFRTLYITWTPLVEPVGGNTVSGVQGRYFIPIMLFVCAIFANKFLAKYKITDTLLTYNVNLVYYTSVIFGIITILTVLLRYWA